MKCREGAAIFDNPSHSPVLFPLFFPSFFKTSNFPRVIIEARRARIAAPAVTRRIAMRTTRRRHEKPNREVSTRRSAITQYPPSDALIAWTTMLPIPRYTPRDRRARNNVFFRFFRSVPPSRACVSRSIYLPCVPSPTFFGVYFSSTFALSLVFALRYLYSFFFYYSWRYVKR